MDRLVRVNIANAARYIGMGQTAVGSEYKFSYSPDGTIAMRPMAPSPHPYISSLGIETAAEFLQKLFLVKSVDPIRRMVEQAIIDKKGEIDGSEEEAEVLYGICENIIASLPESSRIVKLILPGKPSIRSAKVRHNRWEKLWNTSLSSLSSIQSVKRYRGNHISGIVVPLQIWDMTGWGHGFPVAMIERDDGTYQIRPAMTEERKYVKQVKPIDREGIVRGQRYLYLTKTQRAALGIGPELWAEGVDLKFTFDLARSDSFTVEKLSAKEKETLPTMPMGCKPTWFKRRQIVQRHVSGPIILPTEFCRRYDIQKDDVIASQTEAGKLTFFGRKDFCSICGTEHDRSKLKTVPVCGECADAIPEVAKTVKENGSVSAAVATAKADLLAAMNKLNLLEEGK